MRAAAGGDQDQHRRWLAEADDRFDALIAKTLPLYERRIREANVRAESLKEHTEATAAWLLGLAAIITAAAMASAAWIVRISITNPIDSLAHRMWRLADGDHGTEIDGPDRKDEVGGWHARGRSSGTRRSSRTG